MSSSTSSSRFPLSGYEDKIESFRGQGLGSQRAVSEQVDAMLQKIASTNFPTLSSSVAEIFEVSNCSGETPLKARQPETPSRQSWFHALSILGTDEAGSSVLGRRDRAVAAPLRDSPKKSLIADRFGTNTFNVKAVNPLKGGAEESTNPGSKTDSGSKTSASKSSSSKASFSMSTTGHFPRLEATLRFPVLAPQVRLPGLGVFSLNPSVVSPAGLDQLAQQNDASSRENVAQQNASSRENVADDVEDEIGVESEILHNRVLVYAPKFVSSEKSRQAVADAASIADCSSINEEDDEVVAALPALRAPPHTPQTLFGTRLVTQAPRPLPILDGGHQKNLDFGLIRGSYGSTIHQQRPSCQASPKTMNLVPPRLGASWQFGGTPRTFSTAAVNPPAPQTSQPTNLPGEIVSSSFSSRVPSALAGGLRAERKDLSHSVFLQQNSSAPMEEKEHLKHDSHLRALEAEVRRLRAQLACEQQTKERLVRNFVEPALAAEHSLSEKSVDAGNSVYPDCDQDAVSYRVARQSYSELLHVTGRIVSLSKTNSSVVSESAERRGGGSHLEAAERALAGMVDEIAAASPPPKDEETALGEVEDARWKSSEEIVVPEKEANVVNTEEMWGQSEQKWWHHNRSPGKSPKKRKRKGKWPSSANQ